MLKLKKKNKRGVWEGSRFVWNKNDPFYIKMNKLLDEDYDEKYYKIDYYEHRPKIKIRVKVKSKTDYKSKIKVNKKCLPTTIKGSIVITQNANVEHIENGWKGIFNKKNNIRIRHKPKVIPKTIFEKGIRVYKNYFCGCSGHERIPWKKTHEIRGIPEYILGHNSKGNSNYGKDNYYKINQKKCKENIRKSRQKYWQKYYNDICPYCDKRKIDSNHHIIPRKYNGFDSEENYIKLCDKCHDVVEVKTEDWIKSGKHYNIDILRSLIINKGF